MVDIKGYEGLYAITSCGRVWSYKRKIFLKPSYNKGYLQVSLCKNGKGTTWPIHKLVAEAYLPNPESLPCINHIDEIKDHNWVSNLEWCSYKYNSNYGNAQTGHSKKVRCIDTGEVFDSLAAAERHLLGKKTGGLCWALKNNKPFYGMTWEVI